VESTIIEWEAPDFEEIGCAPEVTMYIARSEA
jgi:coenzyme PQQ precursor peptide PqqA